MNKTVKNNKCKVYKFSNLINDFNYYAFKRYAYNGKKGMLYYIEPFSNYRRRDTIEQYLKNIEKAKEYGNVVFLKAKSEYAPEQIKQVLFVANV